MEDDIYQLQKSSGFEPFGNWKYGLFSSKKLMERWYLLCIFELFIIFQYMKNMVFRAVFIKKETLEQVFSCEFCEIFGNTFSYRTPTEIASIFYLPAINSLVLLWISALIIFYWHTHEDQMNWPIVMRERSHLCL